MKFRFALLLLLSALVLSACGAQGAPVPADPVEAVKTHCRQASRYQDIRRLRIDSR